MWTAAALVLVTLLALAFSLGTHQNLALVSPSTGKGAHPAHRGTPKAAGTRRSSTTTSTSPPGSAAPVPATAGAPVLSSLNPSSGSAGQVVVITGANLMSAEGQILASFGGMSTATSCPSQSNCTVTVPAVTGPPSAVPVTITTESGTSDALTFDYGATPPGSGPAPVGPGNAASPLGGRGDDSSLAPGRAAGHRHGY